MIEVPGGFNGPALPPDQELWNQVNSAKTYNDLWYFFHFFVLVSSLGRRGEEGRGRSARRIQWSLIVPRDKKLWNQIIPPKKP
jgi:hypothetical protein